MIPILCILPSTTDTAWQLIATQTMLAFEPNFLLVAIAVPYKKYDCHGQKNKRKVKLSHAQTSNGTYSYSLYNQTIEWL